ncbi:MAG TPA: hypothetical protein VF112_09210 [Candidatus Dormibacteraeota bacterium]
MTSTHAPATEDGQVEEAPLINPTAAPPATATPPVAVVERQSPLKRLLAAFGIGRIR